MRQVSMAMRDEVTAVLVQRYAEAGRHDRGRILDEMVAITGHHRKHAARLLRGTAAVTRSGPRPGRRTYDEAVREALVTAWEAGDRICGKRLKVLLPSLVEAWSGTDISCLTPGVHPVSPDSWRVGLSAQAHELPRGSEFQA